MSEIVMERGYGERSGVGGALEQRYLGKSRLSWGAIIAGAVATLGIGFLLLALGTAIGMVGGMTTWWTGLYSFLSIVIATFFGAYLASHFSNLISRREGQANGLIVWALSMCLAVMFGLWSAGMATSAGVGLASATLQTAGSVAVAGSQAASKGGPLTPQQQNQLQQQMQQIPQNLPSQGQIQSQLSSVGQSIGNAGTAFFWWFFITAAVALLAALLGGARGTYGEELKERVEVRRRDMRPTETRA